MTLAEQLRAATRDAQRENDLPDYLAARIAPLADRLVAVQGCEREVVELIGQLQLYDTYGQTGYLGMGVNHLILESTLARLEKKLERLLP